MGTVSNQRREDLERTVLRPLVHTGKGYYLIVGALSLVVLWALYAYSTQHKHRQT